LKEPEETEMVNLFLRDSGRIFSNLRDAHVRQVLIQELNHQFTNKPYLRILQELQEHNRSNIKETEYSLLTEKNDFLAFKDLIENENQLIEYFSLDNSVPSQILAVFTMSYTKSSHAYKNSVDSTDPNLLHEWRKRLKDVQYQFELIFDHLNPEIQKHYLTIQDLCNVLGEINDLEMIIRWISENRHQLTSGEEFISEFLGELTVLKESRLEAAIIKGSNLYQFSPDRFKEYVIDM